MFPIEDLRQAVETAKRILTKEKLDKQLTGQTSASPFMSIREGTNRKVSFDTRDEIGDKIYTLTVMLGNLAAKDNNEKRPFKTQIYQSRGRGQNRGYSQRNYQNRNRLNDRSSSRDRGQFRGRPRLEQDYRGNNFQNNAKGYGRQHSRRECSNDRCAGYNRDQDRPRERSFSGSYSGNRVRSANSSRSRSGSRASTNRDRIRCYNCSQYDHFARDCSTSREERDLNQLQQMLNMEGEEQMHLLSSRQSSPAENSRTSPLNL